MKQSLLYVHTIQLINYLYLFSFILNLYGCETAPDKTKLSNKKNIENLFNKYKQENTTKSDALNFIVTQLRHHGADSISVTGEYLRENIDKAYEQCKDELRSGALSFNDFCEYVLPYRLENEPIEDWRQLVTARYKQLFDSLINEKKSKADIISFFNKEIGKGFQYEKSAKPIEEKSWSMLANEKRGECGEMTHMVVYPLRAFGIPVSIDFSVCWANSNGKGHTWNALITADKSIPFMGLEANPDRVFSPFTLITNKDPSKTTYRRCGKVFRHTFSVNEDITPNDPIFGNTRLFKDVTSDYFNVSDLSYATLHQNDDKYYYICNYTYGEWVPVFYGIKQKEHILFKNMATQVLYLPVIYDTFEKMNQLDFPVGLTKAGSLLVFKPDLQKRITVEVKTTQPIEEDQLAAINRIKDWNSKEMSSTLTGIINGKQRSKPINKELYKLYYWNNDWVPVATARAANNALKFTNVPSNSLYKVAPVNSKGYERPFSYNGKTQQWW